MLKLFMPLIAISIAHRLSTLENCDVLLVIEDGRLVIVTSDVSTALRGALVLRRRDVADPTRAAGQGGINH